MSSHDKYHLTKPSYFTQQLTSLEQQLPSILDDFEKYYIFYNMNPSNSEYQRIFENIKNNLNTVNSKTLNLSNGLEKSLDEINKKLKSLDIHIQKEKETNVKLKKTLGIIEQKGNSSNILINNYKQLYDINYLQNWALFLSIVVAGYSIFKISKNKIYVK
jgi:hypothetical protein